MSAYGVLRVEKIKMSDGGGLRGRAMHDFREFPNSSQMFEKSKTITNEYEGATSYEELRNLATEKWSKLTGKPRSDAVGLLEAVVTFTPGSVPKEREKEFFALAKKEISSWYGSENVLAMCIHRDETTPHAHFFIVPMETVQERKKHLSDADKRLLRTSNEVSLYKSLTKLNAQKLLGGREKLSQLQTEFHKNVFSWFGLERGEIGQTKKNKRSELSKEFELLELEKKELEKENQKIQNEKVNHEKLNRLADSVLKDIADKNADPIQELKNLAKGYKELWDKHKELKIAYEKWNTASPDILEKRAAYMRQMGATSEKDLVLNKQRQEQQSKDKSKYKEIERE